MVIPPKSPAVQIEIPKSTGGENQHHTCSDDVEEVIWVKSASCDLRRRRRCCNGHGLHIKTFPKRKLGDLQTGGIGGHSTPVLPHACGSVN